MGGTDGRDATACGPGERPLCLQPAQAETAFGRSPGAMLGADSVRSSHRDSSKGAQGWE